MKPRLLAALVLALLSGPVFGDVKMPAIFSDHMVLQQTTKIPVWGWADPGEQVVVSLGDQKTGVTADNDGHWGTLLNPIHANGGGMDLTIAGKNTIAIHDVLIGDVWLCAGEANMSLPLVQVRNNKEYLSAATAPQVRVFEVRPRASLRPMPDCHGHWIVSDVTTVKDVSGLAFLFGKQLHDSTGNPVGIIGSYCDNSPACAWVSRDALTANSQLASLVTEDLARAEDELPDKLAVNRQNMAKYLLDENNWQQMTGAGYDAALVKWAAAYVAAKQSGGKLSNPPKVKQAEPKMPPVDGAATPTVLSNGMIAPLVPYALKGVLWYQGESDVSNVSRYSLLLPALIADWRNQWAAPSLPFIVVQAANVPSGSGGATGDQWAQLRAVQAAALSMPQVGLVATIDVGDPKSIRASDKNSVSRRAVLVAKHLSDGDGVLSGPIYDKMSIQGDKIRITFKYSSGGFRTPKPKGATAADPIRGFEIAGTDKQFQPAQATMDNDGVTVWSDQISQPAAVRYGWADNPTCNLSGKEGLPVVPFRTDSW